MPAVAAPKACVDRRPVLTSRQVQVVAGLARGGSAFEIACGLGVGKKTVHNEIRLAADVLGLSGDRHVRLVDHGYRSGVLAGLVPELRSAVDLSPPMVRVLDAVVSGVPYGVAAAGLGVPVATFGTYSYRLRGWFGARTRAHLVALAWQQGLVGGVGPVVAVVVGPRGVRLSEATDWLLASCFPGEDPELVVERAVRLLAQADGHLRRPRGRQATVRAPSRAPDGPQGASEALSDLRLVPGSPVASQGFSALPAPEPKPSAPV